jgi:hypothetical protein
MAAMGRQEPVMNDCCPVGDWVAGKPTLAIGSTRCIAEVGFRLANDIQLSKLLAPNRTLALTGRRSAMWWRCFYLSEHRHPTKGRRSEAEKRAAQPSSLAGFRSHEAMGFVAYTK